MQNTTNTTGIAVPPTENSPGIVYIILLYVHYITPLVAVLMNWLCILVLRHGQKRRPTTPAVYFLIHVSYFDTIAMIAPFYVTYSRFGLWKVSRIGCRVVMYLSHCSKAITIWLVVIACIERANNANNGFKHASNSAACKVRVAYWMLLLVMAGEQIFVIMWMDNLSDVGYDLCFPVGIYFQRLYMHVHCSVNGILNNLVPFMLIVCLNTFTVSRVKKVQPAMHFYQIQMTITVIMVSCICILLYIPNIVAMAMVMFPTFRLNALLSDMWLMSDVFDSVNQSCKILTYVTYSWLFREDLWHLLCCKSVQQPDQNDSLPYDRMVFTKHVASEEVVETESVTFHCETSEPGRKVKWCHNDQTINPGHHYEMRSDGTSHMLTIHNVTMDDLGRYKASVGTSFSSAHLQIKEKPSPFHTVLEDQRCIEGDDVVFECVTSVPKCNMLWLKGEMELLADDRFELIVHGQTHQLVIRCAELTDSGIYTSVVDRDYCSAMLEVEEKVITDFPDELVLTEGQPGVLLCTMYKPVDNVLWYKNDQVIIDSDHWEIISEIGGMCHKLKIHTVDLSDAGEYIVEAEYHSKTVTVTVQPDIFLMRPKAQFCTEGDDLLFECKTVETNPRSVAIWEKDGHKIECDQSVHQGSRYELTAHKNIFRLGICNAQLSDRAMYQVTVKGQSSSFYLGVKEIAELFVVPLHDTRYVEQKGTSDAVILQCKTSVLMPSLQWKKDGKCIEEKNEKYQIVSNNCSHKLVISDPDLYDSGIYSASVDHRVTSLTLFIKESDYSIEIQDTILSVLESAYPIMLSVENIRSMTKLQSKTVLQFIEVLEYKRLVNEIGDKDAMFTRSINSHTTDEKPVHKLFEDAIFCPDVVILCHKFSDFLAVNAVVCNKTVFVSRNAIGGATSRIIVTGNIGKATLLATKFSHSSNTFSKGLNCSVHSISYLLGKFQACTRWFVIGVASNDHLENDTAQIGDVIVSLSHPGMKGKKLKHVYFKGKSTTTDFKDINPVTENKLLTNCCVSICGAVDVLYLQHSTQKGSVWYTHFSEGLEVLGSDMNRPVMKTEQITMAGITEHSCKLMHDEQFPHMMDPINMSHPYNKRKRGSVSKATATTVTELAMDSELAPIIASLQANLDDKKEWVLIRGLLQNTAKVFMTKSTTHTWQPDAALHSAALMKCLVLAIDNA